MILILILNHIWTDDFDFDLNSFYSWFYPTLRRSSEVRLVGVIRAMWVVCYAETLCWVLLVTSGLLVAASGAHNIHRVRLDVRAVHWVTAPSHLSLHLPHLFQLCAAAAAADAVVAAMPWSSSLSSCSGDVAWRMLIRTYVTLRRRFV